MPTTHKPSPPAPKGKNRKLPTASTTNFSFSLKVILLNNPTVRTIGRSINATAAPTCLASSAAPSISIPGADPVRRQANLSSTAINRTAKPDDATRPTAPTVLVEEGSLQE